jgi:hypothetical protein
MFIFRTHVNLLVVPRRTIYTRGQHYLDSCILSSGDIGMKFIPTRQLLLKQVLVHSLAYYGVQSYTRVDLSASKLSDQEAE